MLARAQIKENAKGAFRTAYWPSVGTFILLYLIISVPNIVSVLTEHSFFSALISLFALAVTIVLSPLGVGMCGYFLGVYRRDGDTRTGRAFNIAFSQNYGRKLGGMAWTLLWSFLWALIAYVPLFFWIVASAGAYAQAFLYGYSVAAFFESMQSWTVLLIVATIGCMIPFIIKMLSYHMTYYILADCPNVTAINALKLSKRMTRGHKGDIFVMGLSFVGWNILTILTFGILGVFWTGPYYMTALAGQYDEMKRCAIETGAVSAAEFEGGYLELRD